VVRIYLPEPLSDTQNQNFLKKPEKRVTKMPGKSDIGVLVSKEHP